MINLKTIIIFSFFEVMLKRIKRKTQNVKRKTQSLLLAFCFLPFAFCTSLIANGSSQLLGDSLLIQGNSVTANISDVVTINFTVNNFVDVSSLGFSINWNPSLIQFTSVSNIGIVGASTANVDVSRAPMGIATFSWADVNQTLPNQTNLLSISFKILRGGKLPIKVNINDIPMPVTCTRLGLIPYPVIATAGTITVLNGCNSQLPALKCADAPLLCAADFPYCASMPDTNSITNPGNKCGKVDNNVWVAFKPAEMAMSFKINIVNCSGTKPAADGIQVSVYTTSDFVTFKTIYCNSSITRNFSSVQMDLNNLQIDSIYYLMVDGNNNDICDFSLEIISGKLHGNGATAPSFTAPDSVCNYQTAFFSINNPDPSNQYQWRLGAGATALLPKPTIANTVKVFWDTNPDSVCARTITPCDTSAWTCKRIPIRNMYTVIINAMKCSGSAYVWNGKSYGIAGDYPIKYKSSAGCDSVVTLHLTDYVQSPRNMDTVVCGVSFVFLGQTYNAAGMYSVVAPKKNFLGCDSVISLRLTFLTTSLNVSKSNDLTCTLKTAQLSVTVNSVTPNGATSTFEWKGSNNAVIGTSNVVTVNAADVYTVTIKTSYQNTTCTDSKMVTLKNIGAAVPKAIIVSPNTICNGQANSFSVSNTDADTKSVSWTASNGTVVVNGFNAAFTPSANNAKLCAGITNACGVGDTSCVSVVAKEAPINPDFVGVFNTCPASQQNYIITQSQANVNYTWSVTNGTIIGSSTGSIVSVQWNSTDGKVCVTASNGCGNPLQVCKNVSVSSASANKNAIVGRTNFCAGESLTYSIAVGATDKVQWSVPTGFTAQSKIDSNVLVGVANNGFTAGKLCVSTINSCNVRSDTCLTLLISNSTPDSVPIIFNNGICSDDTSTFSLQTLDPFRVVNWNLPTGAKIVSGANTKTIRVVWQNALLGAPLGATYFNSCNASRTTTVFVTVKDAVINAPNMDGPKLACPKTRSTYSIPQQSSGISYTWRIPSGGTIEGRADSSVIKVFWDSATTGDVCVDLQNACKVKKSVCLSVDVRSTIDSLPISGSTVVCADSLGQFSVSFDENADSYFWRPPLGATIMSGAGTNQVKIKFPSGTSGNVCCYPNGGCADGTKSCFFVSVIDPPALPSQISGNASVCVGDTVQFSIIPTAGTLGINWRVPQNLEVLAGLFSKIITAVVRDTFSDNVCMSPQGNCKNTKQVCLHVVSSQLPTPKIVADTSVCSKNFTLQTSNPVGVGVYQWRLIQAPIGGTATITQRTNTDVTCNVSTNMVGVFVFSVTQSNGNCKKEVTTRVKIRTAPLITNVTSLCTRESDYYTVSFTMSSPTAQQFVVNGSTSGSAQGNSFSSFFIKQNTPYWFVVTDESGCTSDTLRGQVNCPCYSQAGNITSNNTTACYGDSIKIQKATASALDRNDTEEFILYSVAANGSKQFLQRNKTGIFVFDSTKMSRNIFYTVQLLVGDSLKSLNSLTSSIVDTTARCFSYSSNSLKVNFRSPYNASISFDTIVCPLSLASAQFSTNAPRNVTFTLIEGTNSLGYFNATNGSKLTIRPSTSGYIKLLNPKDDAGCVVRSLDSTFVNVRNLPLAKAGDNQAICARTTTLNANVDTLTTNGHWESSNSAVIASHKSATTKVSNLENGKNVFVWVVSDKVCPTFEVRDSVNIFLPFIPKTNSLSLITKVGVPISANLVEAAPNGTYTITRVSDPNTGRFDFFSDGKFNYIPDSKYVGIVKFKFVICSALCNAVCDTGEVRILINADSTNIISISDTVEVPNAITPNGDGKNDYLQIDNLSFYPNNELLIFNRWGETVFQAKPYNNDWSGNNQTNSPLPVGTYYYLLRLDVNNGKILKGDITILRN